MSRLFIYLSTLPNLFTKKAESLYGKNPFVIGFHLLLVFYKYELAVLRVYDDGIPLLEIAP